MQPHDPRLSQAGDPLDPGHEEPTRLMGTAVPRTPHQVDGTVVGESGAPAARLPLQLVHVGFNGATTRLAQGVTDPDGGFAIPYEAAGPVNLEVSTVDPTGALHPLSRSVWSAPAQLTLRLVVPASVIPRTPEHDQLTADLATRVGPQARLAGARQDEQAQDITMLASNTGWDPRLVAMAANADRIAGQTGVPPAAVYGLLRVGLPADPAQLAQLTPDAAELALRKAVSANIVSLTEAQLREAQAALVRSGAAHRRATAAAPGTLSTVGDMLAISGLTAAEQDTFAGLAATTSGPQLWRQAQAAGISDQKVAVLRQQGQLAQLTLNNAPLVEALSARIRTLPDLVRLDLHTADAWKQGLRTIGQAPAGTAATGLTALIPPAYPGASIDDRLNAYAEDLARKVRLALPTHVVARRVETGELPVPGGVATLLRAAADSYGYAIGATAPQPFLRQNGSALLGHLPAEQQQPIRDGFVALARLYQITPDDESIRVLLAANTTSAYQVTVDSQESFVAKYSAQLDQNRAQLIYRKAQQVSAVVYNAFAAASQLANSPAVYGVSAPVQQIQQSQQNAAQHLPTIEGLFGSLDFCECEDCRSVLSPAAYLVDLLRFLDTDSPSPYDALVKRRPDLPELPLTCENTNTALPYIDIVNEILEFAVAGQVLSARDVGAARTEDLIAEPQYLIPEAYDNVLAKQAYPIGLPFDLWLETVRRFLSSLGVSLADILDVLRPTDALDPAGPQRYGRRSVFLERLGLTPKEVALYTDPSDAAWYTLYGYPDPGTAATELAKAKTLADRLKVSYVDLDAVVRSRFVNPGLASAALLDRLDLTAEDVRRYLASNADPTRMSDADRAAMKARLTAAGIDDPTLQTLWANDLHAALVLSDTQPDCSFDHTVVRFADGTPATAAAFKRINFLVRLRQRLGWSLSDMDGSLAALFPSGAASLGDGMASALVLLSHLDALTGTLSGGASLRARLPVLWRPMGYQLYRQLFLTPGVTAADPGLDNAQGAYLSAPNVPLADHLTGVQAATGLTAADIAAILTDTGSSLAGAFLTTDTVSTLYRYRLLAKALRLSVSDVIALKGLSGINPFAPVNNAPITDLTQDPGFATLTFAALAQTVADSGIHTVELDYLIRDIADPAGPLRPSDATVLALAQTMAAGIAGIRTSYPTPADPLDYTDALFATAAPIAFPAAVATMLLGLWSGTSPFYASVATPPNTALIPKDYAAEAALDVRYDTVRNVQRLTYRGMLTDAEFNRLTATYPSPLLAQLLTLVKPEALAWFTANLTGDVGPFAPADFAVLFGPAPDENSQRVRRQKLVDVFLPYLRDRLVRDFVVATLVTDRAADPTLVAALVTDTPLLTGQLPAYTATGTSGFTVAWFTTPDASGPPTATLTVSDVDTSGKTVGTASATVDGWFQVPTSGAYAFTATGPAGVVLRMDHLTDPVLTTAAPEGVVDLVTGATYHLRLTVTGLAANTDTRLTFRADGVADGPLGRLSSLPAATIATLRTAYTALAKTVRLAQALDLSVPALRQFDWLNLNAVTFDNVRRLVEHGRLRTDIGVGGDELIEVMRQARRTYPAGADLNAASAQTLADLCDRFATLARRPVATVTDAVNLVGIVPSVTGTVVTVAGFRDENTLRRLWTVLAQAQLLGVPPLALGGWADPAPTQATARAVRETLKARFSAAEWLAVAKPVADALRRQRRDALVAHLVHTMGFVDLDGLYEYFLVDPGTEPVVQTSRIRLAMSSVQLFVQRCLLNLEAPVVTPGAINATQWEWMKRFRVWEANRKIFLWPENWLEPEWRDDKTHLFVELEGTLLQGDVTNDQAEDALYTYLSKLEELARLEVVSTWLEQDPTDPAANTLHVLGRTHHNPHKYFYRTWQHQMWTPWQPVTAQVDGDHVVLAVWRNRPCLFWLTFVERADTPKQATITAPAQGSSVQVNPNQVKYVDMSLNWAELVSGRWSTGNSSDHGQPITHTFKDQQFDRGSVFVHAVVWDTVDGETVQIVLSDGGGGGSATVVTEAAVQYSVGFFSVSTSSASSARVAVNQFDAFEMVGRNSKATAVRTWGPLPPPFTWKNVRATQYTATGPLHVWYTSRIDDGKPPVETKADTDVLALGDDFSLVIPPAAVGLAAGDNGEIGSLIRPFFYQNRQHAFFVEPSVTDTAFTEWQGWMVAAPSGPSSWVDPSHWQGIPVQQAAPHIGPLPDPDPMARYGVAATASDAVIGAGISFQYGQSEIKEQVHG
jgi:hypothetical protein